MAPAVPLEPGTQIPVSDRDSICAVRAPIVLVSRPRMGGEA